MVRKDLVQRDRAGLNGVSPIRRGQSSLSSTLITTSSDVLKCLFAQAENGCIGLFL